MDSVQICGSAEGYFHIHGRFVNDMIDKSNSLVTSNCNPVQEREHSLVGGHIQNNTEREIKFQAKHEWSGRNKTPYPRRVAKRHAGRFVHTSGCRYQPDIAAVVYAGSTDPAGTMNVAYLVAWSIDRGCHSGINKVYVETGAIEKYTDIDWCDIKAKLDANVSGDGYCVDEETGSEAYAKITNGNHAALVASFCFMN